MLLHQAVEAIALSLECIPVVHGSFGTDYGLCFRDILTLLQGFLHDLLSGDFTGVFFHFAEEVEVQLEHHLVDRVEHIEADVTIMVITLAQDQRVVVGEVTTGMVMGK